MNGFNECDCIFNRSLREDSVAEIEYVPRASRRLIQYTFCLFSDLSGICQQNGRIKISLDAEFVPDSFPCPVQSGPPVNTHDLRTRLRQQWQQCN